MNSLNASGSNSNVDAVRVAEETLRLIATLPTPRGLEDRVIAGLRTAPRAGRVISFPRVLSPAENWFRAAAAAAIAFLVVGGGWSIYSRVQPAGVNAIAPQTIHSNGFSNAGAVRVPQTLQAPIVKEPALVTPPAAEPATDHGKAKIHTKRSATPAGSKAAKSPLKQLSPPAR